jgi:hypothetical protein
VASVNSWLIIGMAVLVMWALWGFMNWILNLFEYWYAARRGEAMKTHKERERS